MSKVNGYVWGKQFVKTPVVAFGVTNFDGFQSGQLVKVAGDRKSSRFVRDPQGNMFVVSAPATRGARVSLKAFRLACGKVKSDVVKSIK